VRRLAVLPAALVGVVLVAGPGAAANPVLDPATDGEVAAALAEARDVQGVCYGYVLDVSDFGTGEFAGTFAASSAGPGRRVSSGPACPEGTVELQASITYTSELSEAEDSASWSLLSTVGGGLTMADVEQASGSSTGDLLDDGRSETALLNAVLALPGLVSERTGVPPLTLDPNTEPLPSDARATGTPGSDWLRENGLQLGLFTLLLLGGVVALVASFRRGKGASSRPPGRHGPYPPPGQYGQPGPHPPPGQYGQPEPPRLLGPPRRPGPGSGGPPGSPWEPPPDPSAPARGNPA
jgi:hypothetical protein